ncbi:kinesin-like protein KIF23 isoform X1 [Takifugu rubripes]|uniref:kinesin-like protein KIF23 isoform X1 n=2 Tax=Takifugu rubripes TaxID=31033 RepID=UPI0011454EAD|nr:kinesin-like protein KIF23 isoform X1 [Takifugu rubripes]
MYFPFQPRPTPTFNFRYLILLTERTDCCTEGRMSDAEDGSASDVDPTNRQNASPQVLDIPPLPYCELTDPRDDVTLPRLIEALQDRHRIRQTVLHQYSTAADTARSMLHQLDSDLISKENTINEQNNKLAEKETVIQNNKADIECLEKKLKVHEEKIDVLQTTNKQCEDDKNSLQQELQSREQKLQQELSVRRRMEQHLHRKLEDTKLKWEKECDRRVNAIQVDLQTRLLVKEEKLKQVKAIIMESQTLQCLRLSPRPCQPQDSSSEEELYEMSPASPLLLCVSPPHPQLESFNTSSEDSDSLPRKTHPVPSSSTNSCVSVASVVSALEREGRDSRQGFSCRHSPMEAESPARSQPRRSRRRAGCWTPQNDEPRSSDRNPAVPVEHYKIPVRPLHRRFCSAGQEKWVDHRPTSSLDLGSMMRPVIPNAIEVSSPSEKALAKCDKYVLMHQELASDDEIRTQLIKGEVIKTRGGGQAVQFTDIETLKQELIPASR